MLQVIAVVCKFILCCSIVITVYKLEEIYAKYQEMCMKVRFSVGEDGPEMNRYWNLYLYALTNYPTEFQGQQTAVFVSVSTDN